MLTEYEVNEAWNRVSEIHNNILREHSGIANMAVAEALHAGISPESLVEIVNNTIESHTQIPVTVVMRDAPWITRSVLHAVIVGIELGKTIAATVSSEADADLDVPDFPPEPL